jgi:hypothetical protein
VIQVLVGQGSRGTGVHSGKRRRARWRAEGVCAEGVAEADAFVSNPVMIGSLHNWVSSD